MPSSKETLASLLHPQRISDFTFDASFGWRGYILRPLFVRIFDKALSSQVISTLSSFPFGLYFRVFSFWWLVYPISFQWALYLEFSLVDYALAWSLMNFYFHLSLLLVSLYVFCLLVCIRCSNSISSDQHLLTQLHGGTMVFKDTNPTCIDL
jgi:hypothetical protein